MLKLQKGGHRELERYYPLLETDFDSEELLGKLAIHRGMMNGSIDFLVLRDEESGMDAGYALMLTKNLYGYVDMKYMAVMPWFRGRGFGVQLMREINKRYADAQGIVAELTEFPDPDKDRLRKLRKFFSRFGYVQVESDYRLGGAPVTLMVKPLRGPWDIAPIAHRMIRDFYSRCLFFGSYDRMIDIKPAPAGEKSE